VSTRLFPPLDAAAILPTRDALHAYARVLGGWLKKARSHRKHWWHASLRPSLTGLTTGVVRNGGEFELDLDFLASQLRVRTPARDFSLALAGQSAASVAHFIDEALASSGVSSDLAPGDEVRSAEEYAAYSTAHAIDLQRALASVAAALEEFRAGIREETSPIQVWPHHFDLSMLWLPGPKVAGQDPANEEYADRQMNFGFTFGDGTIAEPYLYVTAYPLPDVLPVIALPAGTSWRTEGFSGAVLLYKDLAAMDDPAAYLLKVWSTLLAAGQAHLANGA